MVEEERKPTGRIIMETAQVTVETKRSPKVDKGNGKGKSVRVTLPDGQEVIDAKATEKAEAEAKTKADTQAKESLGGEGAVKDAKANLKAVAKAYRAAKDQGKYWALFKEHKGHRLLFGEKSLESWIASELPKSSDTERKAIRNQIDYAVRAFKASLPKDQQGNGKGTGSLSDADKARNRGKAIAALPDSTRVAALLAMLGAFDKGDLVVVIKAARAEQDLRAAKKAELKKAELKDAEAAAA
jgi:hypothetical protein